MKPNYSNDAIREHLESIRGDLFLFGMSQVGYQTAYESVLSELRRIEEMLTERRCEQCGSTDSSVAPSSLTVHRSWHVGRQAARRRKP